MDFNHAVFVFKKHKKVIIGEKEGGSNGVKIKKETPDVTEKFQLQVIGIPKLRMFVKTMINYFINVFNFLPNFISHFFSIV